LEAKELFMLSRFTLIGNETVVASCFADAEMFEGFDSSEDAGRLRRNHCGAQATGDEAREDHVESGAA
jgi:hypothetical protein